METDYLYKQATLQNPYNRSFDLGANPDIM
jgi:hypothetical protein